MKQKKIYIYGASGHGAVVAEIAKLCGYDLVVFVDDAENSHAVFDAILCDAPLALGVGLNHVRQKLYEKALARGFEVVTLVHPSAIISPLATLQKGTVIMAGAIINAKASIGEGVIVNSGAIVEHECEIGAFVHLSPRVTLAGCVRVGAFTHVGIGSCAIQGVAIGTNCIIGAGSVVVRDIESDCVAYGNPCRVRREQ